MLRRAAYPAPRYPIVGPDAHADSDGDPVSVRFDFEDYTVEALVWEDGEVEFRRVLQGGNVLSIDERRRAFARCGVEVAEAARREAQGVRRDDEDAA